MSERRDLNLRYLAMFVVGSHPNDTWVGLCTDPIVELSCLHGRTLSRIGEIMHITIQRTYYMKIDRAPGNSATFPTKPTRFTHVAGSLIARPRFLKWDKEWERTGQLLWVVKFNSLEMCTRQSVTSIFYMKLKFWNVDFKRGLMKRSIKKATYL
jgi:hypothetical protein